MNQRDNRLLAGQRLMVGFEGTTLNSDLRQMIQEMKIGGIILFKSNIQSPAQVSALCADAQAHAESCRVPRLFIAVDQEGGTVARLPAPFTLFPGNPSIHSLAAAENFARITAAELRGVGINMNLAPVMDVVPEGVASVMAGRAFPGDAGKVAALGTQVIQTLQAGRVMAVAKHFPGIGRTVKDSHYFLPELPVDLAVLEGSDLIPFQAAVASGVSGIMLSHISYPCIDDTWQASLSPFIANTLLRKTLGYRGLVLTDDLDMKAISHGIKTCIRQILLADIDLALICHKGPDIRTAWEEILQLMEKDGDLAVSGKRSLARILDTKKRFLSS
jgi:beta-N-acetylhexosaminidase